jgi:polyhydroxybutyrate depolymerase
MVNLLNSLSPDLAKIIHRKVIHVKQDRLCHEITGAKMKNFKIWLFISISVALLSSTTACGKTAPTPTTTPLATPTATIAAATLQPGDSERTLTVNGVERTYLLHIPPGLTAGQSEPLVFVFHGFTENASMIQQASGFNDVADKNGFIVVYPNGSGTSGSLSWNASGCCGSALASNIDESAFVRQIISDLGSIAKIDPKRTYASGFSNGALLSYRLACEMSDTFAAVAPVAGVLLFSPCQPTQPVSIIDFHGLTDNVVPYAGGGTVPSTGKPFPPVEQSLATWVNLDGCSNAPTTDQSGLLTHTAYGSCKNGSAVELYTVQGIGHSWPSQYIVPASEIIWDFFKAHPKP